MLDYQRIVDDVRGALLNNADAVDDFLQAAAADYSLAVDEANQRLATCGALLRKGLRSEAIQLCEIEPNLLDVVETLDFPERPSWNDLLAVRRMAAPSPLLLDVAADLNQAYAIEQPLAKLLRRHRLLALGRGPLKHRVEVLRSLAGADPENAIWEEDLRTFETDRIKELQKEVPQAIFKGNHAAIKTLAAELQNPAWRTKPEALVWQIIDARSHDARQQGLSELQSAAEQLHAMHVECDIEGGRRARAEWNRLFAAWGQFADPALLAGIGDALNWLREQDELEAREARHKQAVALLLDAVTARKPADELHRLHGEARREGAVPQSVQRRYEQAIETHDLAARRRMWLSVAIFAGFILVTGGIIATVVWQHLRAARVDRDVAALQRLMDDGNFDQARAFIDELNTQAPRSAADPRVGGIGSKLAKQVRDEEERRKLFSRYMGYVESSIADKLPDRAALAEAEKLAKTDEEKDRVRKAKHDFAAIDAEKQSKTDQEFLVQLKEIRQRADEIEKQSEEAPDACLEKLRHVRLELSKLTESAGVGALAKQPAEALAARIQSLEEKTRTDGELRKQEEAITAACGDNDAFRRALLAYVEQSPHARRAESFRAVADREPPLWAWIERWNQMVHAIGRQDCSLFSKKAAADMSASLRKLLDDRGGNPDAVLFRQRLPYLEAVAHRTDSEGNAIEVALKPIFTDPLVAGVWMLKDKERTRYYMLEDPAAKFGDMKFLPPTKAIGIKYVVAFDLTLKTKALRGSEIRSCDEAPQRKTGKALAAILDGVRDETWEPSFCRMAETVLKDAETDPLLKHLLLRKILETGCQGSLCMEKGFHDCRELLKNSTVSSSVNWVDPDNAEAAKQRPTAESELESMQRSFADAQKETAKLWRALAANIGREYACVGWLRKDGSGNWHCVARPNCAASGKLVVVRTGEQDLNVAVFEAVGRIDQGKPAIDAAAGAALAEGRPVYVVIPPR